jgi:hypothetical protein
MLCAGCAHTRRKAERQANKVKIVTPPRKVSAKMAKQIQDYSVQRIQFLEENPECQVKIPNVCTGKATTVHHSAKRGKNLLNIETFVGACFDCHQYVEFVMSAEERREKGLLITKNDTV